MAVEALADDAHGVSMLVKDAYRTRFVKKGEDKKRSDEELWRESAYDSDRIDLHTRLYVPGLRYREKLQMQLYCRISHTILHFIGGVLFYQIEWVYLGRAQTASALQRAESVHSSKSTFT